MTNLNLRDLLKVVNAFVDERRGLEAIYSPTTLEAARIEVLTERREASIILVLEVVKERQIEKIVESPVQTVHQPFRGDTYTR